MERFIKANLFIICCVAAGLLLIVYLGAFSCEVSWLLEAHGELPIAAYTLCTLFFVMFVATTILIHGLVSGLCWPLFAWSVVIGLLSIPELVLVMLMTTQHWGLQSVHGLTELTSYLIRLIINCLALICVIPTGIKWRRETQVLNQLQGLATRLSLQTPAPSVPMTKADSRRSSQRMSGFENAGYQLCDETKLPLGSGLNNHHNQFGSQNEFNASMFAPAMAQQFQLPGQRGGGAGAGAHRAQSLMDLRCTLPGMYNPRHVLDTEDKNAKYFNITIDDLKNNLQDSHKASPPSLIGSTNNDPIYCSIEPKQLTPPPAQLRHYQHQQHHHQQQQQSAPTKLSRNCISLENLDGINKVQNDLAAYGNNLLQNYTQQQQYYLAMLLNNPLQQQAAAAAAAGLYRRPSACSSTGHGGHGGHTMLTAQPHPIQLQLQRRGSQQQLQYYGGFGYANYANPYITANSKLSLGNESDDYRKYRDVAL
ncbi:uncharacterized protein LOC117784193 isoform X2 [Drosophila innubila]|nr:uncharacterized protein LOC117784193 isoform X2 [Drosophila innubila]XP_034477747.1 uncharacterized protein LOC117784193 isoform X2 [Drosophila innubila]XP_034477748.1 uncharacterized protein LOC117784193 isoform X2 [Drosophila innubila]